MARVLGLVKRLVRGEARNPELYSIISSLSGFCFAGRASLKDKESLESVEIIASLRILASLGYAPEEEELSVYLKHVDEWNEELTMMMKGDKARALPAVARAIRESHL